MDGSPEVTIGGEPAPVTSGTATHTSLECFLPEGAASNLTVVGHFSWFVLSGAPVPVTLSEFRLE